MSTIQDNWVFPIKEKFKLTKEFLDKYKDKKVNWGPIGEITYMRTYSRRIEKENRMENWLETVKRVVEACYTVQLNHCKNLKLPWNQWSAQKSAQEMYDRMFNFKWLPAGRSLFAMGTESVYERGSMQLFNCSMITTKYIDNIFSDPFCFMMSASLDGVGVGFDCLGANKIQIQDPKIGDYVFKVDDSKEGWTECLRVVLEAYSGKNKLPKEIDYSQIRPAGSPIKTSGGIAPGPDPLIQCINTIKIHLKSKIGKLLTSGDIVDIMNYIGVAVVSGGKRRTAQIAFGFPDDEEYISLKDSDKNMDKIMSHRFASNNSVFVKKGMDYTTIIEQIKKSGDPGIINIDHLRHYGRMKDGYGDHDLGVDGLNPCGEIGLSGGSGAGGELCNLVELFPSKHDNFEDFKRSIKYAYLYAKSVTIIPTSNEFTNTIILKNRRLGISLSGVTDAIQKHGVSNFFNWCDKGYEHMKELDKKYSDWLCIQKSIKLTAIKPSGSISLLNGCSSGCHFSHSEYYIRRIRIDKFSAVLDCIKKSGYKIEESAYGDNTYVVEFPIHTENFLKGKNEVSIWEQLEIGAKLQYYYTDNSVSQTVSFKKEEEKDLKLALELYEDRLKNISFLPLIDSGYKQMPYETITKEQYEEMTKNLKPIDFSSLTSTHDVNEEERFCSGDKCLISK